MRLLSVVLARQNLGERSHEETLHQERCARKAAWDLAKNIYKLKNSDKTTCYTPIVKGMPARTSTRPEEREFVVDSGASMHMMSRKRIKLRRDGHSKKVQNPCIGVDWKRRIAPPRGGTSESVRNRAITRGNVCSPIAGQAFAKTTDTPTSGSAVKSHD